MLKKGNKVVIVGAGQVGATTAYTLLLSGLASELVLIDLNVERTKGEVLDLSHSVPFCPPADVIAGDYPDCKDAALVILTAGANQKPGETRMDLTKRNIGVFASIVPKVMQYAPPGVVLLVVTNPVDVLTYVTQKLSGLPKGHVLGSGTVLDTARLRYLLSSHTGIDARNVHTYVLGEHGDTELPAYSLTTIAGMTMDEYCASCKTCTKSLSAQAHEQFEEKVRNAAYTIIQGKGATYYAVAVAVRRIAEAVLRDEQAILTVSSRVEGIYDLPDVCLSLPCVVGGHGVERVLAVHLSPEESLQLRRSAEAIRQAQALFDDM